ncbi:MAG: thermopsin family protease [Thaumarchaeota archaeon]|nr:thermopsin family protease [Nitrososphaerota archaeon]
MLNRLKVFSLILLLVAPAILLSTPVAIARAQSENEQTFTGLVPALNFNYTAITVTSPSLVGYATKTDSPVQTAFMTPEQLSSFGLAFENGIDDIGNSVYNQTGTENYNAILEVPGTYYLVVANPTQVTTSINALYIVDPDINLENSTTNVGVTITMEPGQVLSLPLHVETLGSPSKIDIVGASSQAMRYALVDNTTQQTIFVSNRATITNFTVIPSVSIGYNFSVGPGLYVMGIQNDSPNTAVVYFSYTIIPEFVNPYILHFGPPSPTGIAAYGIYNNSGNITPYKIDTSSVVGFADISQLTAVDNGTNTALASLQENTLLQVNNTDGASFTYWPQNVLAFDTSVPNVTYRNNVLNVTGDNAQLTNQSIIGVGTVGGIVNGGVPQTYYGNYNSNYTYTYTLPQTWVLYTNETVEQGQGVLIQMGVRALDGPNPNRVTWFDKITIEDPNVATADFIVNGRSYTPAGAAQPIGTYYDAELVFGGGAGGEAAQFQVNANLALFYLDQTLKPFPSLYTFGDDTAEAAFNILVTNGNGVATATNGTPYYGILTNNFNSSLTALVAQSASAPAGGASTGYIVVAAVIAAIVILALVAAMRRRASKATLLQAPAMTQPLTAFCGNCGTPLDPGVQFCPNCGAPRASEEGSPATTQPVT